MNGCNWLAQSPIPWYNQSWTLQPKSLNSQFIVLTSTTCYMEFTLTYVTAVHKAFCSSLWGIQVVRYFSAMSVDLIHWSSFCVLAHLNLSCILHSFLIFIPVSFVLLPFTLLMKMTILSLYNIYFSCLCKSTLRPYTPGTSNVEYWS